MRKPSPTTERLAAIMRNALTTFAADPWPKRRPARKRRLFPMPNPRQDKLVELLGQEWDEITSQLPPSSADSFLPHGPGRTNAARLAIGLLEAPGRWFTTEFGDWAYGVDLDLTRPRE